MKQLPLLIYICLFIYGPNLFAQEDKKKLLFLEKDYTFPYNLENPVSRLELPSKLREVSGICFVDHERIAAVQDEKGNLYVLSSRSGEILYKIDFAEDGDYEGITLTESDAWVLKSNGDLYRIKDWDDDNNRKVKKYETGLSKKNDMEGIAYDKKKNRLLLATKGHPYINSSGGKHKKAIYQFDLDEKKLRTKPLYVIDLDEIKYFRKYNTMTRLGIDLLASLDESKGDVTFQPSGLAVHPLSGDIYIIGSVGDLLLVLHPEGEFLALVELGDRLFNQPEGICFGPEGELFISNEAGDSKASLLKFLPE